MNIPNEIIKATGINPNMSGEMFLHAEETFKRLENITEKEYISDDTSYAVKTLERYYKGFLIFAQDNTPYRIPYDKESKKYLTEKSHNLDRLRREITLNFPEVFPQLPKSEDAALRRQLIEFSQNYYSSSYEKFVPFETFREIVALCKKERAFISDFLSDERPFGNEDYDDFV